MFKKNKKLNLDHINVRLIVSDENANKMIKSLGITESDLKYLKNFQPIILDNIDILTSEFYNSVSTEKDLLDIINKYSTIDKLKGVLKAHISEMFSGVIDDAYIQKRKTVALRHVAIGLPSRWYMSSFDSINSKMYELIVNVKDSIDQIRTLKAISRVLNLEQQLVLSAFDSKNLELQEEDKKNKKKLSEKVVDSSSNLASISEEVNASYHQIISQTKHMMELVELSNNIARIMINKADESRISLAKQSDSMNNIAKSTGKIEEDLKSLDRANKAIEDILSKVRNIADQTNLLSLNASIEAARAGEHGKGFAVVAQEVKKLSHQSKSAIDDVSELLFNINSESEALRLALNEVSDNVKQGESTLLATSEGFVDIMKNIKDNNHNNEMLSSEVKDLSVIVEEMLKAFEQVTESAEKLSDLSQDLLK